MATLAGRTRGLSLVVVLALLASAIAGLAPRSALAAPTETVTNLNDSGPGSLRQAIADVDAGGTIGFAIGLSGAILLNSELAIDKDLTIDGPGADVLALSGQDAVRVIYIMGSEAGVTVTLRGLAIEHGYQPLGSGGGVYANANSTTTSLQLTLHLEEMRFSANTGSYGGAVLSNGVFGNATLTVVDSTFSGNSADYGAAIVSDGQLGSASLTVTGSTFYGNTATANGGAIHSPSLVGNAIATVTNSTFSGNSAEYGGAVDIGGYSGAATLTVTNSTFADNSATTGGAVYGFGTGGNVATTLAATILAGSTGSNCVAVDASFTSLDYNLADDATCNLTQPNDQIVANAAAAGLAPLADNGGPTETHALLPTSPALDAAGPGPCLVPTDQRGIARPVDGDLDGTAQCDIGAFEYHLVALAGSTLRAFPSFNRVQAGDPVYVYLTTPGDTSGTLGLADARVGVIPCSSGGSTPSSTQPAASVGGLRYQASQDRYLFIWKTNRLWYPGCRQLVLTFSDGNEIRVNAQFVRRRR